MQGPDQTEHSSTNKELPSGIARVSLTESRSGIPLSGWNSVRNALQIYVSGSDASNSELDFKIAAGPRAAYLPTPTANDIAETVIAEAEPIVSSRGRWYHSYDHDGPRQLFKTSVGIRQAGPNNVYILTIGNPFGGYKIEEELADSLGIPRVIASKGIRIDFAANDDTFQINFDQMAKPLHRVVKSLANPVKRRRMTGDVLMKQFIFNRTFTYSPPPLVLGTTNGLEVTADLKNDWFGRFQRVGRTIQDMYQVHESVVTGPLGREHAEQSKSAPYLNFEITPEK